MTVRIPEAVRLVCDRLTAAGFEAHPVGGCVRDSLLNRLPGDWDICTSALPTEILSVFSDCRCITTGMRHGTVTVLCGGSFEITTYRSDGAYIGHRRPEQVCFVRSLREDLSRRDFTVNAMALTADGSILDYFGGIADIAAKCIRCVGHAETRFEEDALRILRALRFAARLGFSIESQTADAMRRKADLLACLSAERMKTELWGILSSPAPARLLREFAEVLASAVPVPAAVSDTLDAAAPVPELRLCLLFSEPERVSAFLKCSRRERERVSAFYAALSSPPTDRFSLISLLARLGEADLRLCLRLLTEGAKRESELNALLTEPPCLSERVLNIDSRTLSELGFSGKQIGDIRKQLLHRIWEGSLKNEASALLAAAKQVLP